jgi:hypothetical protein
MSLGACLIVSHSNSTFNALDMLTEVVRCVKMPVGFAGIKHKV